MKSSHAYLPDTCSLTLTCMHWLHIPFSAMGLFDCQRGGGSAVGWDVWEGVGFSVFVKPEYVFCHC